MLCSFLQVKDDCMNRRKFISASAFALLSTACAGSSHFRSEAASSGSWEAEPNSPVRKMQPHGFCQMLEDGKLSPGEQYILRDCEGERGPIGLLLSHDFSSLNGQGRLDICKTSLTLVNRSQQTCEVFAGLLISSLLLGAPGAQQIYLPLAAGALADADDDKRGRLKDCKQSVGEGGFLCHYLEPEASDPRNRSTKAPLLAPVLDIFADGKTAHLALFSASTEPMCFESLPGSDCRWRMGRRLRLKAGESHTINGWVLLHFGDATTAWSVFHEFGHHDEFAPIAWPRDVQVHYYDFLGPVTANGQRGGGYDEDLKHFAEFHVGMATQHGYYLCYGDYIHPDRKEWIAMPRDACGPVRMSLEKVRNRVDATRRAGVHPAIYMHFAMLDEGSPSFEKLQDAILIDEQGKPVPFYWTGPDTIKKSWQMSQNSRQWQDHLVQQARWIMELWNPDAIVLDETFAAWGWDYHKDRSGPLSTGGRELMRELRAAVRSYGNDKAVFSSDCSVANFCLFADGEAGDHCYNTLLGQELYRKPPVRYMAALGNKPWIPCAWMYKSLWSEQMDLARKVGAAVSLTNGWGDGFGLTRLSAADKERMLKDIETLVRPRSG